MVFEYELDCCRFGWCRSQVPLTPKMLSGFQWPASDLPLMIDPMKGGEWSPWPGWRIPPSLWSVAGEMDGLMDPAARLSAPFDRPVLMDRGYADAVHVTPGQ